MATYTNKMDSAGYKPVKHNASLLQKLARKFLKATKLQPTPNLFKERYAEKFPNKDHCQWRGGRLLTPIELQQYIDNKTE